MIKGSHDSAVRSKDIDVLYSENIALRKKVQQLQERVNTLGKAQVLSVGKFDRAKAEQNLSKEQEILRLRLENQKLTEKIKAVSDVKMMFQQKRNSSTAVRKIIEHEKGKSQDLLKVIQKQKQLIKRQQIENSELKDKLAQAERQMRQTAQSFRQKNDLRPQFVSESFNDSLAQKDFQSKKQVRQVTRELDRQRQRTKILESKLQSAEFEIGHKRELEDQIQRLRRQTRQLQNSIRKLTQASLRPNVVAETVDYRAKAQTLEDQVKRLKIQSKNAQEGFITHKTKAEMYEQKLRAAEQAARISEEQYLELKKKSKLNPVLNEIIAGNKLERVLGFLAHQKLLEGAPPEVTALAQKSNFSLSQQNKHNLKKIQTLILEKAELATELQRTSAMLQSLRESYGYKDRITEIERKEVTGKLKEVEKKNEELSSLVGMRKGDAERVFQTKGVRYGDDVSQFSNDTASKLSEGENYFDFYVGQMNLIERVVLEEAGLKDARQLITIVTVDFFNYETQNTKPGKGHKHNFMTEMSFKVHEDQLLAEYLEKETLLVDIWGAESNKSLQLGTAKVPLKQLLNKSRQGIAPVVSSQVSLYVKGIKISGTLSYKMRMRLPIHQLISKKGLERPLAEAPKMKRLIINIEGAEGLSKDSCCFVYFTFQGKDYHTKSIVGSHPNWDYWTSIEVAVNEDFVRMVRRKPLEFVVIDDNAPLNTVHDYLGTVQVSLVPMLDQSELQVSEEIKGQGGRGQLYLKMFWHGEAGTSDLGELVSKSNIKELWEDDLKAQIKAKLSKAGGNVIAAFRKFDKDDSHTISEREFEEVLLGQFKIKASKQQLKAFYGRLPKPLNLKSFDKYFGLGTPLDKYSIKEINQLLSINSEQLSRKQQKQVILVDFLAAEGRRVGSALKLALEMDLSADGSVSELQLVSYLMTKGVTTSKEDLRSFFKGKKQMKVADFIQTLVDILSRSKKK